MFLNFLNESWLICVIITSVFFLSFKNKKYNVLINFVSVVHV